MSSAATATAPWPDSSVEAAPGTERSMRQGRSLSAKLDAAGAKLTGRGRVAESSAELAAAGAWWSRAGRFSRVPPLGCRGLVALRQATVGVTERRRLCVPKDEPVAQSCHGPACEHPADVTLERRPRHRDHGRRCRRAASTQAGWLGLCRPPFSKE
ncbi:hypothetical protein ACUV84_014651 [Puccinellia chinampoensis]